MGWIMPSTPLEKLRLAMTAAVLPGGQNRPLLLYLCHLPMYEWECTEGGALARPRCPLANGASTINEPDVPSKGGMA